MKRWNGIRAVVFLGILFVLAVAPVSAQNSVPSPKDTSCWESLPTLRACSLEQYNRELDYEQRCTSYPEYQCAPAPEQNVTPGKKAAKSAVKPKSEQPSAVVMQPSESESVAATATSQPIDAK